MFATQTSVRTRTPLEARSKSHPNQRTNTARATDAPIALCSNGRIVVITRLWRSYVQPTICLITNIVKFRHRFRSRFETGADHLRQGLELMEWRRRRQRPFQRGRARAPGILAGPPLAREGENHVHEEHQHADGEQIGADRRDEIPVPERVRIVGDPPWHARKPQKVLWEEDRVGADEREPEVNLAEKI